MAKQSLESQIEEKKAEIAKLEAEIQALNTANLPQYPKHIQVPAPKAEKPEETTTVEVKSEAEEKAALSTKHKK